MGSVLFRYQWRLSSHFCTNIEPYTSNGADFLLRYGRQQPPDFFHTVRGISWLYHGTPAENADLDRLSASGRKTNILTSVNWLPDQNQLRIILRHKSNEARKR